MGCRTHGLSADMLGGRGVGMRLTTQSNINQDGEASEGVGGIAGQAGSVGLVSAERLGGR